LQRHAKRSGHSHQPMYSLRTLHTDPEAFCIPLEQTQSTYFVFKQHPEAWITSVRSLKMVEEFDPNGRLQTSRGTAEELGDIGIMRICQ